MYILLYVSLPSESEVNMQMQHLSVCTHTYTLCLFMRVSGTVSDLTWHVQLVLRCVATSLSDGREMEYSSIFHLYFYFNMGLHCTSSFKSR